MKSTEELSNTISSYQSGQEIKCIKKNVSKNVCTSETCSYFPFVCADQTCPCNEQHSYCTKLVIASLVKALKRKIITLKPIQQQIQKTFQKIIDKVYDCKNDLLEHCKRKMQNYFGLESLQADFMKAIQKGKTQNITGNTLWNIFSKFTKVSKLATKTNQLQKRIQSDCQKFEKQLDEMYKNIKIKIENYANGKFNFVVSKIVQKFEDLTNLEQFFSGKSIKSTSLLYRASQNGFSISKFHQKCDGVNHTLIICKTQYDKVIGAYTPLSWNNENRWLFDNSNETFLFSLTNNHKFKQVNQSNTIYGHQTGGPYFGGSPDFFICDRANQMDCTAHFGAQFSHPNYIRGNSNSHNLFTGSTTYNFKLKQWEVYQIEFSQ